MASNEQSVAGFVLTDAADPKLAEIYSEGRTASDPYTYFSVFCGLMLNI